MYEPSPIQDVAQPEPDPVPIPVPVPVTPKPKVIVQETVVEVSRPDEAWPYIATAAFSAAVAMTVGAMLIHNKHNPAVFMGVILLLLVALVSSIRASNPPPRKEYVRSRTTK